MPAEASPALGAPDTWVAPLARAVPALVLGLVITFSQDHSAAFGIVGFGAFAVVTSAVLLASGLALAIGAVLLARRQQSESN